jgi:enoyl-[acyl-carrier protein] reductase/trans-2-enoyl-CoA reductase (NAD+)
MYRLFATELYNGNQPKLDEHGRVRIDNLEMDPAVQAQIKTLWQQVSTENIRTISDIAGYKTEFLKLFGFGLPGIDYDAEVEI